MNIPHFFSSIQVFKYLYKNGVKLDPSLWLYAIHSDNAEIINLLEENEVQMPDNSIKKLIRESIKCHHNDITNYLLSNYSNENFDDDIILHSYHYYNFLYFPNEIKDEKTIFNYACKYDYYEIVEYLLKTKNIELNEILINNF